MVIPGINSIITSFIVKFTNIIINLFKNSKLSQYNQINSLILAELLSCHKEEIIHGIPAPTVFIHIKYDACLMLILALLELIETDSLKRKNYLV